MGKWLMVAGGLVFLVGAALAYAPGLVTWFGRLPGDIRFESGGTKVFIPITSMIVLSVVLTLVVNLFKK